MTCSNGGSQRHAVLRATWLSHPANDYVLHLHKRATQVVISMGDFARGLKMLKSSASLDPECPIPYVNAARAYLGMNDLAAARRQVSTGYVVCMIYDTRVMLYSRLSNSRMDFFFVFFFV